MYTKLPASTSRLSTDRERGRSP